MRAADQHAPLGGRTRECAPRVEDDGTLEGFGANASQIVTLDKASLTDRAGKLSRAKLELVLSGIDVVLGR
jgi:mRNA-degrading endonuclease toxin of MazEF toxin-antitoxin module